MAIAVYSISRERWFYWNSKTQRFDLMEREAGRLSWIVHTPILLDFDRSN